MKTISRYIMTLALLLTAVTGAWAEDYTTVFELNGSTASVGKLTLGTSSVETGSVKIHTNTEDIAGIKISGTYDYEGGKYFTIAPETGSFKKGDKVSIAVCFNNSDDTKNAKAAIYAADGATLLYTTANGINGRNSADDPAVEEYVLTQDADLLYIGRDGNTPTLVTTLKVERPASAEPAITVEWNAATKTGTFSMPGSDVVLTPIYAKAAAFATTGSEPDVKTLLPEAAEGVIAGTDASLIAEGTGIVAFAGTSTEVTQGTLMYAIGTSATEAPALTAFSATAPTAKDITAAGDVYVWYYIKGADTPQGQTATAENTFNDSEICAEPIKVTVLSNKFDITFKAANANTIEAGKATVTVGGTAATVTEGKLEGVKMGSEVKMTAKEGYKFRKVEAKKAGPTVRAAAEATAEDIGKVIGADGNIYADAAAATAARTTAVAMIAYVGSANCEAAPYNHGLALALSNANGGNTCLWRTPNTDAGHTKYTTTFYVESGLQYNATHNTDEYPAFKAAIANNGTAAPTGCSAWFLASGYQWAMMVSAAGGYSTLKTNAGLDSNRYWSSSERDTDLAWYFNFSSGKWGQSYRTTGYFVRSCLAF